MAEGQIKHKYLLETLGNLIRSLKMGPTTTPYQLDDLNYAEITQSEKTLLLPEPKYIKMVQAEAKRVRGLTSMAQAYMHLAHFDDEIYAKIRAAVL